MFLVKPAAIGRDFFKKKLKHKWFPLKDNIFQNSFNNTCEQHM